MTEGGQTEGQKSRPFAAQIQSRHCHYITDPSCPHVTMATAMWQPPGATSYATRGPRTEGPKAEEACAAGAIVRGFGVWVGVGPFRT